MTVIRFNAFNEGQRFRDITQGTDGTLYSITDQGRLYRIDRP